MKRRVGGGCVRILTSWIACRFRTISAGAYDIVGNREGFDTQSGGANGEDAEGAANWMRSPQKLLEGIQGCMPYTRYTD